MPFYSPRQSSLAQTQNSLERSSSNDTLLGDSECTITQDIEFTETVSGTLQEGTASSCARILVHRDFEDDLNVAMAEVQELEEHEEPPPRGECRIQMPQTTPPQYQFALVNGEERIFSMSDLHAHHDQNVHRRTSSQNVAVVVAETTTRSFLPTSTPAAEFEPSKFEQMMIRLGLGHIKEGKFTYYSSDIIRGKFYHSAGDALQFSRTLGKQMILKVSSLLFGPKFCERTPEEVRLSRVFCGATMSLLALLVFFIQLYLIATSSVGGPARSDPKNGTECSPYAWPGYLKPSSYQWRPIPSQELELACPHLKEEEDTMAKLTNELKPIPSHLANKVVLLIGDSQERKALETLCAKTPKSQLVQISFDGQTDIEDKMTAGNPRACIIRRLKGPSKSSNLLAVDIKDGEEDFLTFVSLFHFGLEKRPTNDRSLKKHVDDGDPIDTKDRIRALPRVMKSIGAIMAGHHLDSAAAELTPDLVIAHSNLWDLQAWNAHDVSMSNNREGIYKRIDSWPSRASEKLIAPIQTLYPNAKIMIRNNPVTIGKTTAFPSEFVAAMNMAAQSLATHLNLPLLDWMRVMEGQRELEAVDGVHFKPEGYIAFLQMVFHQLL